MDALEVYISELLKENCYGKRKKVITVRLVELLNNSFSIFKQHYTHIFTYTYFKKLQTTLLKLLYQTSP